VKREKPTREEYDNWTNYISPPDADGCRTWTGKRYNSDGQQVIFHPVNGSIPIHRFLLVRYLGRPLRYRHTVVHKCGNKNCVSQDHLMEVKYFGVNKSKFVSKLTAEEAKQIRNDSRTANELAKLYNVSSNNIGLIKRGKTWKNL